MAGLFCMGAAICRVGRWNGPPATRFCIGKRFRGFRAGICGCRAPAAARGESGEILLPYVHYLGEHLAATPHCAAVCIGNRAGGPPMTTTVPPKCF